MKSQVLERRRRTSAGFTAMELLCATALASLLLASTLGVLTALAKQHDVVMKKRPSDPWKTILAAQLRRDLLNARQISVTPQRFELAGFGGRDFSKGTLVHRRAKIAYYIARTKEKAWLARREVHVGALTNDNARTELVCSGVARLAIEAVAEDGSSRRLAENPSHAAVRLGRVPDKMRIVFFADGSDEPLFDQTFFIR